MSRKLAKRTKRRTAHKRNRWRDELELANGCLDMVREELESLGLPMAGCAPMFYGDAIHNVAVRLGCAAGFTTRDEIRKVVGAEPPHRRLATMRPYEYERRIARLRDAIEHVIGQPFVMTYTPHHKRGEPRPDPQPCPSAQAWITEVLAGDDVLRGAEPPEGAPQP